MQKKLPSKTCFFFLVEINIAAVPEGPGYQSTL